MIFADVYAIIFAPCDIISLSFVYASVCLYLRRLRVYYAVVYIPRTIKNIQVNAHAYNYCEREVWGRGSRGMFLRRLYRFRCLWPSSCSSWTHALTPSGKREAEQIFGGFLGVFSRWVHSECSNKWRMLYQQARSVATKYIYTNKVSDAEVEPDWINYACTS